MKHREDVNNVGTYEIHDPIRADQHLTDIRAADLGDNASRFGKML